MKRKTILALITVCILSFASCGKQETTATTESIAESTQVETIVTEESKVELLPWLQLSSLETHPELRTAFEELLGITKADDGTKSGVVYTDENGDRNQNNILFNALGNTSFTINCIRDAEQIEKLEEIANNEYADIEENQGVSAVINAYFELLPDQEDGQFDGDATISRAQAMTLVMRATTPVNEAQAPEEDADFTKAVGETQYTNFAAPMNEYTYLNTENGLNNKTFNTTMSRGEYIYLLTKSIFSQSNYNDYLDGVGMEDESLLEDVKLTTVKDGGDISLQDAINNVENGLPTDMYQTLARAVALGFITEDNINWDEAITKSEAVTLFIDAAETYQTNMEEVNRKMFGLDDTVVSGDNASTSETTTTRTDYPDSNTSHQKAWDNFCNNWNESDYGTTTKGKMKNDFPYYGDTGYDPNGTILQERTTDKGYKVMYDTETGRVYYTGMILPTGDGWDDSESGGIIMNYAHSKGYNNIYDVTYTEFQEVLGVYNGD